jgi:hypothetical protein
MECIDIIIELVIFLDIQIILRKYFSLTMQSYSTFVDFEKYTKLIIGLLNSIVC